MLDFFYENIGGKIKTQAKAGFVWGFLCALLYNIAQIISVVEDEGDIEDVLPYLGYIFIAFCIAWVGSWLLYGIGELIETNCEIADTSSEIKNTLYAIERNTTQPTTTSSQTPTRTQKKTPSPAQYMKSEPTVYAPTEGTESPSIHEETKEFTITPSRMGDAICPSCKVVLSVEDDQKTTKCPHCQAFLKVVRPSAPTPSKTAKPTTYEPPFPTTKKPSKILTLKLTDDGDAVCPACYRPLNITDDMKATSCPRCSAKIIIERN